MVETVNQEPTGPESRGAVRREQRRSLIISAAQAELAEVGLAGLTLAGVGARVGLSKAALYYYVDSRDALLALVLGDALDAIRLDAALLAGEGATALDRLTAFAAAHVRASVERPAGPLIASSVYELAALDATAELLRRHTAELVTIVDEAVEAGQLREMHAAVAAAAVFGTLNSIAGSFDPAGQLTLDEVVEQALSLLLDGWRSR